MNEKITNYKQQITKLVRHSLTGKGTSFVCYFGHSIVPGLHPWTIIFGI
jgi:hypothetical protein